MRITSDGFRFDADDTKNGENPTETAGNTRGGGGGSLDAYDNNELKMGNTRNTGKVNIRIIEFKR